MDSWNRIDLVIDRIEQGILVVFLSLMILLAFFQILLRNLFDTGLAWGDPVVRNLVLWAGFIGAALATRERKHISIDTISRWLPPRGKVLAGAFTSFFSSLICALLLYASLKFVWNEAQMGDLTFLRIPSWVPELILPFTFALMTLRFAFHAMANLSKAIRKEDLPLEEKR